MVEDNTWIEANDSPLAFVFVHGILSSSWACWRNKKYNTFWPELVSNDPELLKPSVFVAGYTSGVTSGGFEFRDAADELAVRLSSKISGRKVLEKERLVFVCHSQGGIVVPQMLVTHAAKFAKKEVGIVSYASPGWGSKWASCLAPFAKLIRFKQALALTWGSSDLQGLDRDFRSLIDNKTIARLCGKSLLETKGFWGLPKIVSEPSSTGYFPWTRISNSNHSDIVKPKDTKHPSHAMLRDFVKENGFLPGPATEIVATTPSSTTAPPVVVPTRKHFSWGQLLQRISIGTQTELVTDLLEERWSLRELEEALDGNADRAAQVIQCVADNDGGTWRRLISAFVASKIKIPPDRLISIAFGDQLSWDARFPPLSHLRFTRDSARAARCLFEAVEKRLLGSSFDNERLAIHGFGFLGRDYSIRFLLDEHLAFQDKYANEKLGPVALLAFLQCYLETRNDKSEGNALYNFTRLYEATADLGNLTLRFGGGYFNKVQCLQPGKAIRLFRHFRDKNHKIPLLAVLSAMSERPNPFLLDELIGLAYQHVDTEISFESLYAASCIGTSLAESRLRECVERALPGARAAWLIAAGLSKRAAAEEEIASIIRDVTLPSIRHNAIWAAGELGRQNPDFARKALEPIRADAKDDYGRALAWLGLAKAGLCTSESELQTAFECAPHFTERIIIATAASLAGHSRWLAAAMRSSIENRSPLNVLIVHIEKDVRAGLEKHPGEGGKALTQLLDLGDFI